MIVGILGDIHGNYHSFSKVIEDMMQNEVNKVIFLGDLVFWGNEPQKCYEALRNMNPIVWVRGNTDNWFNEIDENFIPGNDRERKIYKEFKRLKDQLSNEVINHLKSLPERQEIKIRGKNILCVHGSDRNIDEPIGIMTSHEEIDDIFDRMKFDILLCAHTHRPFIITKQDKLIINIGSVGLSMDKSVAEYGLLKFEAKKLEYGIRRVVL